MKNNENKDFDKKMLFNEDDKKLLDEQKENNKKKASDLKEQFKNTDGKLFNLFMKVFKEAEDNPDLTGSPKTSLQKKFFDLVKKDSKIPVENKDRMSEVIQDALAINKEYKNIENPQAQIQQRSQIEQSKPQKESGIAKFFKKIRDFFVGNDQDSNKNFSAGDDIQDDRLAYESEIDLNPTNNALPKLSKEQEEEINDYKIMLSGSNLNKETQSIRVEEMAQRFAQENEHLNASKSSSKGGLPTSPSHVLDLHKNSSRSNNR